MALEISKIEYLRNIESLKYLNNETDFTLPFQENEPPGKLLTVFQMSIKIALI